MAILTDTGRAGLGAFLEDLPDLRPKPEAVPFRCVLDKILLEEIPVEESRIVTPGGLKLERSERFAAKPMTGRVLAVGAGVPMGGVLMSMPYRVGQVVRCSEYGREYINLRTGQNGINAFVEGEKKTFLIRVADTHGEVLRTVLDPSGEGQNL